jgi:hypothetical protein
MLQRKCDMYWPKEGTEVYGSIHVKLIKEDILAMYTIRTLQISHVKVLKNSLIWKKIFYVILQQKLRPLFLVNSTSYFIAKKCILE